MTGFLYLVNPYIPIILSCACCVLSCLIVFSFKELESTHNKESNKFGKEIKSQISDTLSGFKIIIKSTRVALKPEEYSKKNICQTIK